MQRKSFDSVVSFGGLLVAAVLFVAGGLLFWAHGFIDNNVRTQLTAQRVFIPTVASGALSDPLIKPYLTKYAGQQLVDGAQAKAYADHFIAVHLKESTGGRTYSELSTAARANPTDTTLQGLVQTSFRGETLRGMLLNAYAFWKMGQVALVAAWVALASGGLMLFLAILGLMHARRTPYDVALHVPGWHPEHAPTS